ncbi:type II toxin-antitoxin system PemK/MazF family toxin [Acidocella sp.]|uniref:type II toxin-antitoxin system PemK/MazF family toxin n=1 Tax=Acidocella sp. TaxID=50710 RepID=UPI002625585F|nr:type II toxin-antitoxin system PemK/MazF family toxin [Acidocella sp.]
MVFKRWDVVKIPFAVAGAPEFRPALVIVAGDILRQHALLWVLMITSARNSGWPGDVEIADTIAAGLGVPSVVRTAKMMTVEAGKAELIGALIGAQRKEVGERVFAAMGLTGAPLPA